MSLSAFLFDSLLCYGPAAALMFAALILEQRRYAPNGTDPRGNIVRRTLRGGLIAAAAAWLFQYFSAVPFWAGTHPAAILPCVLVPWAFALGETVALLTRPKSSKPEAMDA